MKNHYIVYNDTFKPTPLSFWVHRELDSPLWQEATRFDPPLPKPIPGKGWPTLVVAFNGITLFFASHQELKHLTQVLRVNPLPSTLRLSKDRCNNYGPNSHWLSRLPAKAKSLKFRQQLVGYLDKIPQWA